MSYLYIEPFTKKSLTFLDYPDNSNHSIPVYLYGCDFKCEGCSNPELQKQKKGMNINSYSLYHELQIFSKQFNTNKIVLLGGDPFCNVNRSGLFEFLNINKIFEICIYTGYEWEDVKKYCEIFKPLFVKTGGYNKELKQKSYKIDEEMQFASSNQKLYQLIGDEYQLVSQNGLYKFN